MGGLFDGIGDALGGIGDAVGDVAGGLGDAVGGIAQGVVDNPWALSLASLPFGGVGGLIGGLGEGALGGGLDLALNGAEYGADAIGGLGAFDGFGIMNGMEYGADALNFLDPSQIDPSWFDQNVWSSVIPDAASSGTLQGLSGGLGGLGNIAGRLIPRDQQGNIDWAKLIQIGAHGAMGIGGLMGKGGAPKFTPWTMPSAPPMLQASRSYDPNTKRFSPVAYSPLTTGSNMTTLPQENIQQALANQQQMRQQQQFSPMWGGYYAEGGLASIGGGKRRPKYVSPHDKAVKALRSHYRSRKDAEAAAGIAGTPASQLIQGPGDPLLDEAFAYTKPQQSYAEGGSVRKKFGRYTNNPNLAMDQPNDTSDEELERLINSNAQTIPSRVQEMGRPFENINPYFRMERDGFRPNRPRVMMAEGGEVEKDPTTDAFERYMAMQMGLIPTPVAAMPSGAGGASRGAPQSSGGGGGLGSIINAGKQIYDVVDKGGDILGGIGDFLGFAEGGHVMGPGDGMSDSIPAMIDGEHPAAIATGEYIMPADVVSHLGNGSTDAGAKQLDSMVARLRKARTGRSKQAPAINPDQFLQ